MRINTSQADNMFKGITTPGMIKKFSNQNLKLYTSQGELYEDIERPKIFRTTSLQKSKFPHKNMISVVTDGRKNEKAIIFSLSQKNFRSKRKDSIDEKVIKSVLIKKKKNHRVSEKTRKKEKKYSQKHSKSLNNSEIENKIMFSDENKKSLRGNNFFFSKSQLEYSKKKIEPVSKGNNNELSESDVLENSYLKMNETHEDNFYNKHEDETDNFLMDSQINLEKFSTYQKDSVQDNEPFLDVVSPIDPLNKFKKKTIVGNSKGSSNDYEYLFEPESEKKPVDLNIFARDNNRTSNFSIIPNEDVKKRGSNMIFGGDFTPFHKMSMNTNDLNNSKGKQKSLSKTKIFNLSNKTESKNSNAQQTLQNISFKNFSTKSKDKLFLEKQDELKTEPNKKEMKITDLVQFIKKNSENKSVIKEEPQKEESPEEIEEFRFDGSMIDIKSTTNVETVFDFNEEKNTLSQKSNNSHKKIIPCESIHKLSLFQKHSTANMFEHYQPSKEELNIFKNSMEDLENDLKEDILTPKSSQWNLSHVNLNNESNLEKDENEDKEKNKEIKLELQEEYHILLKERNKMELNLKFDENNSDFCKKIEEKSLNLKSSKLAKKIVRQSRKQNQKGMKKNVSGSRSIYTNKTNQSNSNLTDSQDKQKISLKLKLKNSIAGSTKKSLHSKKFENDILLKKSSHGSNSRLEKTLGTNSLKTKGSFKSHLGFNTLNNSIINGSKSQSKLICKTKGSFKTGNKQIYCNKNTEGMINKMSHPDLLSNNNFKKGIRLRRSHTQKKSQKNNKVPQNKTDEISCVQNKREKKLSGLKLKLAEKFNLLKKKSSCPDSNVYSDLKIYSVDKILNTNNSSQNFENIYNKEIVEQRSKESNKSKSERNLKIDKSKLVDKFNFRDESNSLLNSPTPQIVVNIKSPETNNKTENLTDQLSSHPDSIKNTNPQKLNKQTTVNSTFLPFPRSVSIKNDDNKNKSKKGRNFQSKENTSESNLNEKNTDQITFTEGEEDSQDINMMKNKNDFCNNQLPDEYGMIYENQSNNDSRSDIDFKYSSDHSNKFKNSNKSEPGYNTGKTEKISNLNQSSKNAKKNSNNQFSKLMKKKNLKNPFKQRVKQYSSNFQNPKEELKLGFNKNMNLGYVVNRSSKNLTTKPKKHKKISSQNLGLPKKSKISKSGKNISHKKSSHNINKKSSIHMKNLSNYTKNNFPISQAQFIKTISNISEKIPKKKQIRLSLNQNSKLKIGQRHKTRDKQGSKLNPVMEFNLSFSKPFNSQKPSEKSFNQSSLLGKTFESDVYVKPKTSQVKVPKFSSKLKAIKQESFKGNYDYEKMILLKKDIEKRSKNYLQFEKSFSTKKESDSQKGFNSKSNNEYIIQKSLNSNIISDENNSPHFKNSANNPEHKANNSQNKTINIQNLNINNLVNNQETHNYVFIQPNDYSFTPSTHPNFKNINTSPIFEDSSKFFQYQNFHKYRSKDSGDNKMLYNSFENKIETIINKIKSEPKKQNELDSKINPKTLLSNETSQIANQVIQYSEEITEFPDFHQRKRSKKVSNEILSKSLNLKNYISSKKSILNSLNNSKRNSIINKIKEKQDSDKNLKKRVKQIKSQRKFNELNAKKSSKDLKKEYEKIKMNHLKKSNSKIMKPNKKSLFFNKYNQSEKTDSIYQRVSYNLEKLNTYTYQDDITQDNWNQMNHINNDYLELKKLNIERPNTRNSLRCESINPKNIKRNTSLEAVLQKHSMKFMDNQKKFIDGVQTKIKNWYNLETHLKNQSRNIFNKNKAKFGEKNSIVSLSKIQSNIEKNLKPLKKNFFEKSKLIKTGSVDQKSKSLRFKFNIFSNLKVIKSLKQTEIESSRDKNKNSFSFNKEFFSQTKESLLKKKIIQSNQMKKNKMNRYYCSSNIDNPDFLEKAKQEHQSDKIYKSIVFGKAKIRPKLSKIGLKSKNLKNKNDFMKKKISSIKSISKISPQNFPEMIQNNFLNLKNVKSITSKPTPIRYNEQPYSLRGSNKKQGDKFFSISSQEKPINFTEIPSSSDNITNSSMNSQQKSKLSDINIYNQKDYITNTSGSQGESIYKKRKKPLTSLKKIMKLRSEGNNDDKEIKLKNVISKKN